MHEGAADGALPLGFSPNQHNHLTNGYRNPGPREARVLWANTPQVH